jgi:hypothetical protein
MSVWQTPHASRYELRCRLPQGLEWGVPQVEAVCGTPARQRLSSLFGPYSSLRLLMHSKDQRQNCRNMDPRAASTDHNHLICVIERIWLRDATHVICPSYAWPPSVRPQDGLDLRLPLAIGHLDAHDLLSGRHRLGVVLYREGWPFKCQFH